MCSVFRVPVLFYKLVKTYVTCVTYVTYVTLSQLSTEPEERKRHKSVREVLKELKETSRSCSVALGLAQNAAATATRAEGLDTLVCVAAMERSLQPPANHANLAITLSTSAGAPVGEPLLASTGTPLSDYVHTMVVALRSIQLRAKGTGGLDKNYRCANKYECKTELCQYIALVECVCDLVEEVEEELIRGDAPPLQYDAAVKSMVAAVSRWWSKGGSDRVRFGVFKYRHEPGAFHTICLYTCGISCVCMYAT